MAITLNHTIVYARDKQVSARFFTEIMGLPAPMAYGPFLVVELANGVSLDFMDEPEEIASQHYAFLITESEFEEIFARIRKQKVPFWADPDRERENQVNTRDGGRGIYFEDPDGHLLEILTRPYGSGG